MLWCSVFIPLMQLCFFSTLHVGLECLGTYHWLYTAFLRGVVGYIDFSMNLKSTTKCRTYYWVSHEGFQSEPARFYNRFLIFKTTNVLRLILPVWGFLLWFHSYSQYLFTSSLLTIYWSPVNNLKCRRFNPSVFWSQAQLLTVSLHISFFCFALHSDTCRGLTWHIRLHSIMSSGLPWDAEKNITTDRLRRKIQRLTERAVHIFILTESQL